MLSYPPEFNALPDHAQRAINHALAEAFPDATPQEIHAIHGGMSGARLFKVLIADHLYVLRLVLNPAAINDSARHGACLRSAAERGLAPALHWADAATGVTIMDYIHSQPIALVLRTRPEVIDQFGNQLRLLHDGPGFPVLGDPFEFLQQQMAWLEALGTIPELVQTVLKRIDAISTALQPHLIQAPCHNDLNPANVLFDGEKIWFVDWETAGMNDPCFDLATAVHWFATTPEIEERLLDAYFQRQPSAWEYAKLELMKYVSRCLFGTIFLVIAAHGGFQAAMVADERPLPRFSEALQLIGAGRLQLQIAADAYHFGCVIINEARLTQQNGRIDAALAQLKDRPEGALMGE